jgi:Domain of unknown function (DUF4192)
MHVIQSPSELISSLPGALGFAPAESLVIVSVEAGAIGCVMRIDLGEVTREGVVDRLSDLVARAGADGAVAVIVSADGAMCPMCGDEYRQLVGDLTGALGRRGAQLRDAFVVDRIKAGGRWRSVDNCGVGGVLNDPATSAMAAAAAAAGHRIYGSRDELKASVAVDVDRAAGLAPLFDGVGTVVDCVAASVRETVAAARRMAGGVVLTDAELAGVGAGLADVRVRDSLFTTAESDVAASAEALWALLARVLPQPWRAEALTLLAVAAYLRGDGPLAGIALEAAVSEDPQHRMANMLDTALQGGMRPDVIRVLLSGVPSAVTV